jgi:predicted DNA-binding transcriptional regulator AlpA
MRDEAPEHEPPGPALLTEKQAAHFLGFSSRTLQSWRFRGGGPLYVSVSPRCVRYRREDLRQWIEERLRTSTSDPGTEAGRRFGERLPQSSGVGRDGRHD